MRLKLVNRDTKIEVWHKSLAIRQKAKLFKYISLVLFISNLATVYYFLKN